jgi:hypothetical protein
MITVLLVGPERHEVATLVGRDPSVEILLARDLEETLERLARNRRIDAVLLLAGRENARIARAIRDEDPASPPLFVPASAADVAGARTLAAEEPELLLALLERELSG